MFGSTNRAAVQELPNNWNTSLKRALDGLAKPEVNRLKSTSDAWPPIEEFIVDPEIWTTG
jgi:hypothetical protein